MDIWWLVVWINVDDHNSTAFLPVSFLAKLKDKNSLLGCHKEMIGDRDFNDLKHVLLLT